VSDLASLLTVIQEDAVKQQAKAIEREIGR
jgi:hypothetical protein